MRLRRDRTRTAGLVVAADEEESDWVDVCTERRLADDVGG
jgi:hypothetical protein